MKVLADQIAPHKLEPNQLALCYTLMGQAFQKHAIEIYQAMLRILEECAIRIRIHQPQHITSLDGMAENFCGGLSRIGCLWKRDHYR